MKRKKKLKNFPISRRKNRPPQSVHTERFRDFKANGEIPGPIAAHTAENGAFKNVKKDEKSFNDYTI